MRVLSYLVVSILALCGMGFAMSYYYIGKTIDEFHGVPVYYNGLLFTKTFGRNIEGGYNVGMKYQCVEFVKRFYLKYFDHKMPDSYGDATSFFMLGLSDGGFNKKRGLYQYTNPSIRKPHTGDIVIFGSTKHNPYGHVGILYAINERELVVISQNANIFGIARASYPIHYIDHKRHIDNERILGWLSKE